MALWKLLGVVTLIHISGGLLGAEVGSSIIGGQDAPKGSWPWMAHLNITSVDKKRWRCGGTVLNSEWVLTAASCWDQQREPNLHRSMVWVGSHSLQKESARYLGVQHVVSHPGYRAQGRGYINDVALVKLKKKIRVPEEAAPVTLPASDDTFGSSSECWITGWGYIGTDVPLPDPETLQQLNIPIIPQSVCKSSYPELPADMLCAGDPAGGKDACKGDYGGPLVCRTGGGFVQAGIMSFGTGAGCAQPGRPGVYTEVSKYLLFINDFIHRREEDSAEV